MKDSIHPAAMLALESRLVPANRTALLKYGVYRADCYSDGCTELVASFAMSPDQVEEAIEAMAGASIARPLFTTVERSEKPEEASATAFVWLGRP